MYKYIMYTLKININNYTKHRQLVPLRNMYKIKNMGEFLMWMFIFFMLNIVMNKTKILFIKMFNLNHWTSSKENQVYKQDDRAN